MVLNKHEIEAALHAEHQEIASGRLKEDNPLDSSDGFRALCEACRRGDLRECQQRIQEGVNINARDRFDYTPLILGSLCGHYDVVQLLLEAGALCERDTFQGERALYNALNDRIRNLLLSYDYSKSRDPLQPLAGHITSLLHREVPHTSDIIISSESRSFRLHKFILSARSPYFAKKLASTPGTSAWRVPSSIPSSSLEIALRALYLGEVSADFHGTPEDEAIINGIEKLGRQLEMEQLFETILESDRRIARQKRSEEVQRGRDQLRAWYEQHILNQQVHVDTDKANDIKWDRENSIFADVLLCADEPSLNGPSEPTDDPDGGHMLGKGTVFSQSNGIPVGPLATNAQPLSPPLSKRRSVLFPVHRAMLLRSEYFAAMFSSPFREAQSSDHLPIVHVDCSPETLKVILGYLYAEESDFGLDIAVEVLFAADQLFIDKLKVKAAVIISTLGNGSTSIVESSNPRGETSIEDLVDIYDVVRAGWDTRVHRLEEFGARYIAYRLERFIDEPEFKDLVRESAARIKARQETDTVELIDDIRFYLSERFRLRFEDSGFDVLEDEHVPEGGGTKDDHQHDAFTHMHEETSSYASVNREPSQEAAGLIMTLDGDIAGDEFAQDALNYQILLGKIDKLLDTLNLEA